ncbi:MAG TPA: hypothetical protein VLM85_23705 [Polyangiaceae bacterium]|nr:hypothetical protein [Polyangiaceae bacterium]
MSPARKEDESVQTSLRELQRQEEERIQAERDRLAQLRAAKARIDAERAEAAREAEELRQRREREEQAELEAKKAAATERARLEVLARAEADRRAAEIEERVRLAAATQAATAPRPATPRSSRFAAGVVTGLAIAGLALGALWLAVERPRLATQDRLVADLRADLDRERTEARDRRTSDQDAIAQRDRENDTLRADNGRLQAALEAAKAKPKAGPVTAPRPPAATKKPTCTNPHDPLCGDLDAR